MTTHGHEYVQGLLASCAIDAVSEDEERAVRQHLPACDACARQLAELQGTAAALSALAKQHSPPAELRSRIVSAVLNERKVAAPARVVAARGARRWKTPAFAAVAATVAVLLATSAVLGAELMRARDRAGQSDRLLVRSYEALEIMARAEQRWTVTGTEAASGARGVLAYSTEERRASLVLWELPALEEATYNAWTVEEGRRVPAGRMWREADGFWAVLSVGARELEGIGVTLVHKADGAKTDVIDFPIPDDPAGGAAP